MKKKFLIILISILTIGVVVKLVLLNLPKQNKEIIETPKKEYFIKDNVEINLGDEIRYKYFNCEEECIIEYYLNDEKVDNTNSVGIYDAIITINKEEFKPALFFNILSFVFIIIFIIFGIPVFSEFFRTGRVPRFPTLIFSGYMLIVSLLFYTCGLILKVVVKKHRQLFEIFLTYLKKESDL